ncbi:WS/DGAT/MGAT family O-acyltransferase [Hydrocarboniclastica marina]|uniref:diacylglycerol O-acyltransferase n=1 Tax=Hydrocarboniclastica marina TaxID=2259620 RepID=A0A4P7XCU1_9ALTE|nr:wax ester/triacylglycerol synthase family O-acyltransferase [Hydrocarboniclastica marina]MAL97900.1 wax ester/triacylglycerol synthase family O-acyltransferase [Alteromonadaceae bacterium]QCF24576.1 wax ester/triacylglycerol synthase family O-acyltransferase [Hydrocarboniclastica marina]
MRPLSPVDQLFLWLEKRQQPMHVAGLQLFSFPEDAPDDYVGKLAESLRSYTEVAAPLDQRLLSRFGQNYWVHDDLFDLEHHFSHEALPRPGRIRELLGLVSAHHSHLMDRERPLWECHLIEGLDNRRFAYYIKAHHSFVDGISAMRLAQDCLSTDPARRDLPPIWAQPSKRSSGGSGLGALDVIGSLSHLISQTGRQLGTIPTVARELLRTVYRASRHPRYHSLFHAPQSPLNQSITGSRRFAAQSYSLDRIRAVGKACNATINDIILAMCGGALRDYLAGLGALPDKPLIAMVPMSLRQDDSAGGNQVGMILTSLATHLADPEARLLAIQKSIHTAKARYAGMTADEILNYTALALAPAGFHLLTGLAPRWQTFNVVISNVPGPREPLYWNGARLEGMYPVSIVLDRMALNMTLTSYVDHIEFGLTGCRRTLPSLQRLLDHLENALVQLEIAAGLSRGAKKGSRKS